MSQLNCLGYSVLSETMRRKVFGDTDQNPVNMRKATEAMEEMEKFGVKFPITNPESYNLPDFPLPPLKAKTIAAHFSEISNNLIGSVRDELVEFANIQVKAAPTSTTGLSSEWNYYGANGWESIDLPPDRVLVFDTETFVKGSAFSHPIMATAVGANGYYLWLHPCLLNPGLPYYTTLVDIGQDKILIAHNASYDHCRVSESYLLEDNNFWFDTMSAHINCSGVASGQRYYYAKQNTKDDLDISPVFEYKPGWAEHGSLNNLVDCYRFHTGKDDLAHSDKKTRNIFVEAESIAEIVAELPELITYALGDVYYTYGLYAALLPKYLQANPSLTTLIGHFTLMKSYLPVVSDWREWLRGCEAKWQRCLDKQTELLSQVAMDVWEAYQADALDYEVDPWLSQLDWSMNTRIKKNGQPFSKWYGIPKWLKDISVLDRNNKPVIEKISSKTRAAHLLLRLKWRGSPLLFKAGKGWCYEDYDTGNITQIPHPKKEGENVGSVLSKDFLVDMEDGTLSSDLPIAAEVLRASISVAYWTSARSRVLAENIESPQGFNVACPQVVPHNTSTNRAGCALWLTTPDPKKDKIGSEIKSRVQAPRGWKFVQSDVDAEEALIATIFADAYYGIEGSTQFSHAILAGSKEDGTDMHTMTAKAIGISRSVAKGCAYALLYGCGVKTLANTIRGGNKNISMAEATKLGKKLIDLKKGKRLSRNSREYHGGSDSHAYNELSRIASMDVPRNPLSGTKMSTAFRPTNVGDDFWTSRTNWCIL